MPRADGSDERVGFGRRHQIEMDVESAGKTLIGEIGSGPITIPIEVKQQPAHRDLIEWRPFHAPSRPLDGPAQITRLLLHGSELQRCAGRPFAKPGSFVLEPFLEPLRIRREESGQEVTVIEREPIGGAALPQCIAKSHRVTPHPLGVQGDLLISPAGKDVRSKLVAEEVDRAAEGCPGAIDRSIGPEEREENIATMKGARIGDGKVDQQGEPARLGQHPTELGTL